jgi:hypothetical protein
MIVKDPTAVLQHLVATGPLDLGDVTYSASHDDGGFELIVNNERGPLNRIQANELGNVVGGERVDKGNTSLLTGLTLEDGYKGALRAIALAFPDEEF